ncbi:MAG: ABC transporter ATP-binding protein, partial [Clostridia bacterium]|nr:ABC transporter ATP-binding protein [Clostridia bacterium]
IEVLGVDMKEESKKLYDQIGVQLQETSYQDKIKVYELCSLFMSMYEKPLDYKPLLERFGLSAKHNSYLSDLSGGQRQRIAIILALIANPKLVFLDELTTGLDPKARREMWEYIKELKEEGRTIFMTTHYMEEAEYLCDKICIIDEGKIITIDHLEGVISKADIDIIITFETDKDISEMIKNSVSGISRVIYKDKIMSVYSKNDHILTELILLFKDHDIDYRKIDIIRPTLEDAYLKLTGKEWKE